MVAATAPLEQKFSELLNTLGKGKFNVEVQTHYNGGGLDNKEAGTAGIKLIVKGDALEKDNVLPRHVLAKLSQVPVLGANVQFESDRKHLENMGKRLEGFIADGAQINTVVPQRFAKWSQKDAPPIRDHAFEFTKTDLGIRAKVELDQGIDASMIAKNFEDRKADIVEALVKRTLNYPPYKGQPEAEQAKVAEAVRALDIKISPVKTEYDNFVEIELRSKDQLAKAKDAPNKWHVELSGDEAKKLQQSNPLNWLQDGDGKTPENPANLQKALARAFIFAGPPELSTKLFAEIAGANDVKNVIGKALFKLKQEKPALTAKIDEFINDPIFKEHDKWHHHYAIGIGGHGGEHSDGTDKGKPHITKLGETIVDGKPVYKKGRVEIELPLPALKFNDIMAELEKWSPDQVKVVSNETPAAAPAAPAPTAPAAAPAAHAPVAAVPAPHAPAAPAHAEAPATVPFVQPAAAEKPVIHVGGTPVSAGSIDRFLKKSGISPDAVAASKQGPGSGRGAA